MECTLIMGTLFQIHSSCNICMGFTAAAMQVTLLERSAALMREFPVASVYAVLLLHISLCSPGLHPLLSRHPWLLCTNDLCCLRSHHHMASIHCFLSVGHSTYSLDWLPYFFYTLFIQTCWKWEHYWFSLSSVLSIIGQSSETANQLRIICL